MKDACLRRCRMPLQFVAEHWRDGGPTFPGTRGGRWLSGSGLLVSAALVAAL